MTTKTSRLLHCTTNLACTPASVRIARTWVHQWLISDGAPEAVTTVAVQLTSELVANAAQWTGCSRVAIRLRVNNQRLRVDVEDGSRSLPVRLPADWDDENGRGLNVLQALADRWGVTVHPLGKAVWFELRVPAS
ncbi:ATP-binding protein [Streptacidiphilus neutrinimicus]|uniref:ATP-binding protein n=1 Tax=Streptacidiphilus neutrinimicus TaxID=105420 RepID=UPI00126A41EB|nr:ATP-binding protein [Streptacidiphilus neutrinimicus]